MAFVPIKRSPGFTSLASAREQAPKTNPDKIELKMPAVSAAAAASNTSQRLAKFKDMRISPINIATQGLGNHKEKEDEPASPKVTDRRTPSPRLEDVVAAVALIKPFNDDRSASPVQPVPAEPARVRSPSAVNVPRVPQKAAVRSATPAFSSLIRYKGVAI